MFVPQNMFCGVKIMTLTLTVPVHIMQNFEMLTVLHRITQILVSTEFEISGILSLNISNFWDALFSSLLESSNTAMKTTLDFSLN